MSRRLDRAHRVVDAVLAEVDQYDGATLTILRRFWRRFLLQDRRPVVVAVLLTMAMALRQPAFALTWRFLVDRALCVKVGVPLAMRDVHMVLIWVYLGMNLAIWTAYLVGLWVRTWLVHRTGQRMVFRMRERLHQKLQNLHMGYFDQTPSGRIMSRVMGDVNVVGQWTTQHAVNALTHLTGILAGGAVMVYLDWQLSLIVFATLPLFAWAYAAMRPTVRRFNIAQRRMNASLFARSAERISGVQVVQAFGRESAEARAFWHRVADMVRVAMGLVWYQQLLNLISVTISTLAMGAVIYLLFAGVRDGRTTLGSALAFLQAVPPVFQGVMQITTLMAAVQAPLVCLQRMFGMMDEPVELKPGRIHLAGMSGKIEFDDVTFRYTGQDVAALQNVSFSVAAGERVAIMGPSGSGKSTIFQLLLRFYDVDAGRVLIGGVDARETDSGSLRRHVCMVQQEATVFSGTIAENITYGRPGATPTQIIRAARHADLHEFLMTLPLKYETEVGEQGVTLSGGQRQRLSLATALLTDPEVLLLDDTTSALDAATEAKIRATLDHVLEGRTSLTITQRVATSRSADRIIVLEKGQVSQLGTHEELRARPGFYRTVCEQQES